MVHELIELMDKPYGVVLNKSVDDDNPVRNFCQEEQIPILTEFKWDPFISDVNGRGGIIVEASAAYKKQFQDLIEQIKKVVE
jgi:MinD superfamily P-loop ATPase